MRAAGTRAQAPSRRSLAVAALAAAAVSSPALATSDCPSLSSGDAGTVHALGSQGKAFAAASSPFFQGLAGDESVSEWLSAAQGRMRQMRAAVASMRASVSGLEDSQVATFYAPLVGLYQREIPVATALYSSVRGRKGPAATAAVTQWQGIVRAGKRASARLLQSFTAYCSG
jgi:hypothetical protein